jgi:hypothetical protein
MVTIDISTDEAKVIETTEEQVFAHVMKEILYEPAFEMAFGIWGVKTVWELLSLSKEDLDEYNFLDEGGKVVKLRLMERKKILDAQGWYFSLEAPNLESWLELTSEVFQAHRSTKVETFARSVASVASIASAGDFDDYELVHPPPALPTPAKTLDLAMEFAKGTKRSFNDLKHFKEASQWNTWHRHLISTARAQGIARVYDLTYTPANVAEEKLYKLQNEFAFSCLELAIHTADGKLFLREFQDSGDARSVYRRMLDAYNAGEAGKLKAERIEGELQEMRLDAKWKKGCQHFLTTWEHKVLDLAEVDPDAVTETKKWRWLRLAVLPHRYDGTGHH